MKAVTAITAPRDEKWKALLPFPLHSSGPALKCRLAPTLSPPRRTHLVPAYTGITCRKLRKVTVPLHATCHLATGISSWAGKEEILGGSQLVRLAGLNPVLELSSCAT